MRRVRASVVNLFYAAVILVAAFKSLVFAATLYAEHNLPQVEYWASRVVGTEVRIEQIESSWSGLLPKLWLHNLSLGTDEKLQLGSVRVSINPTALPYWKTHLPLDIKLRGTRIHILRDASGKTRVLGLAGGGTTVAPALPAHIHIEDAGILWEDKKHGNVRLQLDGVDLHVTNRQQQGRLVINAPQHKLLIRADLRGNILSNDWSATTYLHTTGFDASIFANPYLPPAYQLDELSIGMEFWSQWRQGKHKTSRAKLELKQMDLRHNNGQQLTLNSASTRMLFQRDPEHWRLQLSDFNLQNATQQWPDTDLLLELSTAEPTVQQLRIGISHIPLQALNRLSAIFRPSSKIDTMLSQVSPRGELTRVRALLLAGATPDISLQALSADFSALSNDAWEKIPAADNFSGHVHFTPQQTELQLDTHDASLYFPTLFRTPLPLASVQGKLRWQPTAGGGWQLTSDAMQADSPDLKTHSRISISKQPDTPLFMDLQTDFSDGVGANAGTYYPVGIMSPNLVDWLDSSIVEGSVPGGSFLLHGPVADFPYHVTHSGHFEVLFQTSGLKLDYQKDWPPLLDTEATVRFYNNALQIDARSSRILDSKVLPTHAEIPSLNPASAINIQGQASGPLADALRVVRETPLKDRFASAVEGMQGSGEAETKLTLGIPLAKTGDYAFSGQLHMKNAGLLLTDHQLQLSGIDGQLELDLEGIRAKEIAFKALDSELLLNMQQSDHASTLIDIAGTIPVSQVTQRYPFLQSLQASGAAFTNIRLDIPNHRDSGSTATMQINSDLVGVFTDAPAPVGKPMEQANPLQVNLALNTPHNDIVIDYAKRLKLHLLENDNAEYRIKGDVSELPVLHWLDWFAQQETADVADGTGLQGSLKLNIGNFSLGPVVSRDLRLSVDKKQQRWLGQVRSDQLQGSFRVPTDVSAQPLVIDLAKLTLHLDEDSTAEPLQSAPAPAPSPTDSLDPSDFPALAFSCKNLMMDDLRLGELILKTQRTRDGMLIDTASLQGEHVQAALSGTWNGEQHATMTRLQGTVLSADVGKLLKTIYGATPLADSSTNLSFELNWPGAPFQYHPATLQGGLNLEIGKGRVVDLDPGAARLLGLLNVRTLSRRLQLDFSDLYKEGLGFDLIMGSFEFGNGHVYSNDLTIKSPSALIHIAGNADLVNRQYDQLITVSPKLDATLPVAGALVGGPATGLAVLLAQQAMEKPLSKLQRIKYDVQGPWDNPSITRIKRSQVQSDNEDILDL